MHQRIALLLLGLIPVSCQAQSWRVQASGGIGTSVNVGQSRTVFVGPWDPYRVTNAYPTAHLPDHERIFAVWGVSLLRRVGVFELGVQAEAFSLSRSSSYRFYPRGSSYTPTYGYKLDAYIGRPVVPLTAVWNYYPGPRRGNAYVGLHAGVAYAAGREQADFEQLNTLQDITLYYRNTWGFCAGVQAGFRKELGRVDLGFQLQAKYLQFELRHGSSDTRYTTKVVSLPVQLSAGYRFGRQKAKQAPPVAGPGAG